MASTEQEAISFVDTMKDPVVREDPYPTYERFRAMVRGEPLLLVRGRYEHSDRNRNVLVRELVSLAPLARSLTDGADVQQALPRAHHFGHR